MFNKKTVIVVGAGASKEAKLPTGKELKSTIASLLDIRFEHGIKHLSGDRLILESLRVATEKRHGHLNVNEYLHAAWAIRDAMPQAISIDNYMDAHSGDEKVNLCGKLSIVRSILQSENRSLLYFDERTGHRNLDFERLADTWLNNFFQLLTENCRGQDLKNRLGSIALIVFNYDRCIEHYLYHALQNYYRMDATTAASLVNGTKIFHPYGVVGALPWQGNRPSVAFGDEVNAQSLLELSGQIKTFAEGTDVNSSEVVAIRQYVADADILVFLGFAFHRMNLDLLTPTEGQYSPRDRFALYATALGISNTDCESVVNDISKLKRSTPVPSYVRNNLECKKLFSEYWRSLALS